MNTDVSKYLTNFDPEIQAILNKIRSIVLSVCPECEEKISWGMPTYKSNKGYFHFNANKNHLGIYPGPQAITQFSAQFNTLGLKYQKGSLRCPYSKDIPYDLIEAIAAFSLLG